jgi:peptidoglycan hydrolase-like protein with peptidoglycan-binding domain
MQVDQAKNEGQESVIKALKEAIIDLNNKIIMEVLKKGSTGIVVETWQEFLKNLDLYTFKVDGDFGNKTHNATIKFQSLNGLVADGIVGKKSWDKAYEIRNNYY